MKKFKLALALLLGATTAFAQNIDDLNLNGLSFRNIGPALTSGRVADLAVNPDNHDEYYAAIASGGVWKTENHGITYTPIFDSQGSYSIGAVSLAPTNHNVVWVGTGENNNQRSVAYGDGLYKSEDGGKSWKNVGLKESEHIGMIAIHPEDEDVVYVAAYGPLWSSGGDRGIYKTTDGGDSWTKILDVSENTGFNEIHFDPRDPEVLYATAHQRRRHVWTYVSGGPESAIYKSTDGGDNWEKIDNGIPPGDKGRIALAIAPTMPDRVYAMIEGHGVYRSDDGGASFKFMNDYASSGNYYVELVPDPKDPDKVYSMDTYLQVTTDGGKSWERVPRENRHVDDHCLWINPEDTDHMLVGCDGGLYETYDGADNWHFKPNLPVTQFYRVTVDNEQPFYNVYGGTQDNFSLGGPSQTINRTGITNSDWYVTNTGDGFESQIDPKDPNIVYAQAQYGWLVRYDRQSGEKVGIKPYPGKDEDPYRFNWDAPLLISPHDHKTLYFAANKVFKSSDRGNSWTVISPDLTQEIDRHTLPVMGEIQSADAIAYDRSTSPYGTIVAFDESTLEEGLLYVGTDDGLIQVSEDGGENWKKYSSFPGIPKNTYVNQVLASRHDANTVYAVFNNHKNGDFKPYILKSTNRGEDWESISADLPDRGSVYTLQQDHVKGDLLFAGTEFGVFTSLNEGKSWKKLSAGLPTIAIRDMDIQRSENDLVLASFGRGFYILDDYSPLREISEDILDEEAFLFPIDTALLYQEAAPYGYGSKGFQGASFYAADNPEVGATLTYYLSEVPESLKSKRQKAEKEAKKNEESVKYPSIDDLREEDLEEGSYLLVEIKDANGKAVSRFTATPSKGVNRLVWDGRFSSRASLRTAGEPKTNPSEAGLVSPGTYSAQIYLSENGEMKALTEKQDFQVEWLNNNTLATQDNAELSEFQLKADELKRKINALYNFSKSLDEKVSKLKAAARNTPGIDFELLDSLREIELQIADLNREITGDKTLSKRQFPTAPTLMDRIGSVTYGSYSSTSKPTGTQKKNMSIAREMYQELKEDFSSLDQTVEAISDKLIDAGAPYLEDQLPE